MLLFPPRVGGLFLRGEVLINLTAQHIPITTQDAAIIFTNTVGAMAVRTLMKLLTITGINRNDFSCLAVGAC
jgi:hypothetical protein